MQKIIKSPGSQRKLLAIMHVNEISEIDMDGAIEVNRIVNNF